MKYSIGQINRGSELGEFIYCLVASNKNIINIVKSGTWNGLGTTKCILDALRADQELSCHVHHSYLHPASMHPNNIGDWRTDYWIIKK